MVNTSHRGLIKGFSKKIYGKVEFVFELSRVTIVTPPVARHRQELERFNGSPTANGNGGFVGSVPQAAAGSIAASRIPVKDEERKVKCHFLFITFGVSAEAQRAYLITLY